MRFEFESKTNTCVAIEIDSTLTDRPWLWRCNYWAAVPSTRWLACALRPGAGKATTQMDVHKAPLFISVIALPKLACLALLSGHTVDKPGSV